MAKSAIITLTTAGTDTGPFNLLSDVDSYVSPFESNIAKSSLVAGYTTNLVPDAATIIRVKSSSSLCTNYIDLNYPNSPTTTTTSTTTTTTTCPSLYSYTLIYDYNDGLPVVIGYNTTGQACAAATSSFTVYSPSSSFIAGAPLYYDSCGTTPISANPYNVAQSYYKYLNNYVTFELDGYTVRSVASCTTTTTTTTTTSTTTTTTTVPTTTTTTTTSTTTTTTTAAPPTTTTTTLPPPTELFVYAKYVNTAPSGFDELEYQINTGGWLSFGAPINSSTCSYFVTLSGISNGDTVSFRTANTSALNGNLSSCPSNATCATPSITIIEGANYIYLTTDGGVTC